MRRNLLLLSLGALLAFSVLPWSLLASLEGSRQLTFAVLDVGQGDALWIETPDGYQALIDGGPGSTVLQKLSERMPFWDRTIDLLILTHPHADHLSGLLHVLERYGVSTIIDPGVSYTTAEYAAWEEAAENEGAKRYSAVNGMQIGLGKYAELQILSPLEPSHGKRVSNVHDTNVVSLLRMGEAAFLLTGDAEAKLEQALVFKGLIPDVSVLKIGHHGSKTSSSRTFLEAANPEFAVISAGRNNQYGHPAKAVLERIETMGIHVFRTDQSGDVIFETDGTKVYRK